MSYPKKYGVGPSPTYPDRLFVLEFVNKPVHWIEAQGYEVFNTPQAAFDRCAALLKMRARFVKENQETLKSLASAWGVKFK